MANAAAFLLGALVLVAATPPALLRAAGTTHLHMFLHDVVSGSNPTAVQIIKGPAAAGGGGGGLNFGDTNVVDDALTETSSAASAAVGRAQGLFMAASQSSGALMVNINLVLTAGAYNGSTIAVIGSDDVNAKERELSVVGGTGAFRMAKGYVLWKTSSMNGPDAVIELDVYATTAANGTVDASAPVSPLDGGEKGSGSPGSSSSSTSQGAAAARGWVNACVAGVVVVVVGGWVW